MRPIKQFLILTLVAVAVSFTTTESRVNAEATTEPIKPIPVKISLNSRKVALGRKLFNDKRLSRDNSVACVSCHSLKLGGTDRKQFSTGVNNQIGVINAPTVYNSGFNFRQFWDGRAETLEAQAAMPIHDPIEMGSNWTQVISKISKDPEYVNAFKIYKDGMQPKNIQDAIAEFERSLYTPNSRFDRYLRGDLTALSDKEKHGYQLFKSYGCVSCHQGVNVGGNMFQKFGVLRNYFANKGKISKADLGRYNVTGNVLDKHVFKVPSLRLAALTPPYFHDGSVKTLRDAVNIMFIYQLGRVAKDDEKDAIVAFIKSLVGKLPE